MSEPKWCHYCVGWRFTHSERDHEAVEISDRSDYYQTVALWPQPQIPASIKDVADSRIIEIGRGR